MFDAEINLEEISLDELILVTGSFIFSGNTINDIDTAIILQLQKLLTKEMTYRKDHVPSGESVH
jgi:hypothetical protein